MPWLEYTEDGIDLGDLNANSLTQQKMGRIRIFVNLMGHGRSLVMWP